MGLVGRVGGLLFGCGGFSYKFRFRVVRGGAVVWGTYSGFWWMCREERS